MFLKIFLNNILNLLNLFSVYLLLLLLPARCRATRTFGHEQLQQCNNNSDNINSYSSHSWHIGVATCHTQLLLLLLLRCCFFHNIHHPLPLSPPPPPHSHHFHTGWKIRMSVVIASAYKSIKWLYAPFLGLWPFPHLNRPPPGCLPPLLSSPFLPTWPLPSSFAASTAPGNRLSACGFMCLCCCCSGSCCCCFCSCSCSCCCCYCNLVAENIYKKGWYSGGCLLSTDTARGDNKYIAFLFQLLFKLNILVLIFETIILKILQSKTLRATLVGPAPPEKVPPSGGFRCACLLLFRSLLSCPWIPNAPALQVLPFCWLLMMIMGLPLYIHFFFALACQEGARHG